MLARLTALFLFLCAAAAGAMDAAPALRVRGTLPGGTMRFEVASTSATAHVPIRASEYQLGSPYDVKLYRSDAGVAATNGDMRIDGGNLFFGPVGTDIPEISAFAVHAGAASMAYSLPSGSSMATWNWTHGASTILSLSNGGGGFPIMNFGGADLRIVKTASGSASCDGAWNFAGLAAGGYGVLTTNSANINADTLDGSHAAAFSLAGHNHDGVYLGIYDQATDSDQFDGLDSDQFSRSTHDHAGTYLPVAGTAADASKLGGQLPSYYAAASALHSAATLSTAANLILDLNGQQISLDAKAPHMFMASASAGYDAAYPTMRGIVDADIPAEIARDAEIPGAGSTPTYLGLNVVSDVNGSGGVVTIDSVSDIGMEFGLAMIDSSGAGSTPTIWFGGASASAYTHKMTETAGTWALSDTGEEILKHDGSTITANDPVSITAASTASMKVGSGGDLIVDTTNHRVGVYKSPAVMFDVSGMARSLELNIGGHVPALGSAYYDRITFGYQAFLGSYNSGGNTYLADNWYVDSNAQGTTYRTGAGSVFGLESGGDFNFYTFGSTTAGGHPTAVKRLTILNGGNVGVGDASPAGLFTVGNGDKFQVDANGNVTLDSAAALYLGAAGTDGSFRFIINTGTLSLQCKQSGVWNEIYNFGP